jgi:hypothetical protein
MADKLDIGNEMRMFDSKVREFYQELTEEERKKFSNYLMIRWGSSVNGSQDLQEFYVIATNERLNKHFFEINRHPKLQWLCATSVSPGMGNNRHNWISTKKKEPGALKKQIGALFPNLKDDEIEVLATVNTKKDIDTYIKQLGNEK